MKLEAKKVSIEFPGVKALSDVDFELNTGEIRAVVGANGAGKSTLMKVFAGANPGYTGEVFLDGKKVELRTPAAAKALGIEIVYQEVDMALFPSQTVAENIMMNKLIVGMKGKAAVNWPQIRKEAKAVLQKLHIDIDVNRLVGSLSLAQKQMVLIARAVQGECNFLILDEPTAPLSTAETERLFQMVDLLRRTEDIAIVFISHRLQEVKQICNSITIMRNGQVVENGPLDPGRSINSIVTKMLGRSFDENFPKVQTEIGDIAFEVKDLYDMDGMVNGVSLYARAGEIVGISGLVGAGKTELSKTIFGDRKRKSGSVLLHGKEVKIGSPTDAVKCGIGLVPEERLRAVEEKYAAIEKEINRLEHTGVAPSPALTAFLTEHGTADAPDGCSLLALLKRPQLHYDELAPFDPSRPALTADIAEEIEISVKYEGYIKRQLQQVAEFKRMEGHKLPPDLDYNAIQGLRLEAREKLSTVRPMDLGQASRISGVSPADLTALMIWLENKR